MTKPDPMKLEELPEIAMQGPIEVSVVLHCMTVDGKSARLTAFMEPGIIPDQQKIQSIIDSCQTEIDAMPAFARPMTKAEFWALITERASGIAMPMPGNQEFEPIPVEVKATKSMLVHAILGYGDQWHPEGDKWIARGLAEDVDGLVCWMNSKLEKLDEAQLLEIYNEITAD